jgi:hypothetical protein
MASESSITEHCLLCGRELPRGGFSARVAGVLLSPLCVECHRRCTTDPDSVVAEHPPLFDRSEVTERPYPFRTHVQGGMVDSREVCPAAAP